MKKNLSEADSSVSDNSSVSKFISRWNVDGFLTKFPHERDWFLYFGNVYCFPRSFSHLKYLRDRGRGGAVIALPLFRWDL